MTSNRSPSDQLTVTEPEGWGVRDWLLVTGYWMGGLATWALSDSTSVIRARNRAGCSV